jgi:hypothetical protein
MTISVTFNNTMIAPCGINCGTCFAYLRDKNKCPGCLSIFTSKPKTRLYCKIKNCEHLNNTHSRFCYECEKFPCQRLEHIDKRYRTKYKSSLIQNLVTMKEIGITEYLINETNKWTCPNCGSTTSVHRDNCPTCNLDLKKNSL